MQINGQPISTAAGSTLSQLLAQQGFDVARVAVELNGKIIYAAISAKCSSPTVIPSKLYSLWAEVKND